MSKHAPDGIYRISDHAEQRWVDRTGRSPDALEPAWYDAKAVEYPAGRESNYARYHVPTDTVLLARGGALVTVIELSDRPAAQQAFVRGQADGAGGRP